LARAMRLAPSLPRIGVSVPSDYRASVTT
jgi:hypothetical protein